MLHGFRRDDKQRKAKQRNIKGMEYRDTDILGKERGKRVRKLDVVKIEDRGKGRKKILEKWSKREEE